MYIWLYDITCLGIDFSLSESATQLFYRVSNEVDARWERNRSSYLQLRVEMMERVTLSKNATLSDCTGFSM